MSKTDLINHMKSSLKCSDNSLEITSLLANVHKLNAIKVGKLKVNLIDFLKTHSQFKSHLC